MKHNFIKNSLLRGQHVEKEAQSEDIKVNMLDVAEIGAGGVSGGALSLKKIKDKKKTEIQNVSKETSTEDITI